MSAGVIGVRFREAAKIYHFAQPAYEVHSGEHVVVETSRGHEMARIVTVGEAGAAPPSDVRPIVRLAERGDQDRYAANQEVATALLARWHHLIVESRLNLHPAAVQINLGRTEATCFFHAEGHVDFREIVRTLEREFDLRVHMQQTGPRDRAKLVDGYDICGLRLCCASWMTEFPQVGIRMAKDQDLSLNPDKISGVCGRLLCCLTFEYDVYREMRGHLPKVGKRVSTPAGMGRVLQVNVLKQIATLELADTGQRVEVPAAEIGLTVRVETAPNQALVDAPAASAGTRGAPPAAAETTPAGEREEEGEAPRRRRRRRRRGGGGGEQPAAPAGAREAAEGAITGEAAPGEADTDTDTGPEAAARDGEEAAGGAVRSRRRRRRRRGRGGGGEASGGGSESGAGGSESGGEGDPGAA